jgi:hypothetical protein
MSTGPGDRPTARSIVLELLGDTDPPAGVLGEGLRRSARAAVRPVPEPQARPGPAPRRNRPRRAVTIWWAIGIAVCITAIAVAIRAAQNQSGPQAATTKPPATDQPTGRTSGSDRPPGSPTPPPTIPAALSGNWSGQVTQSSPAGTVTLNVLLSLPSGTSGGTSHYSGTTTTFTCSALLSLVSDLADTLTLNQTPVKAPCEPGKITLTPGPAGTLHYSFSGQGAPPATGTLNKQ